MKIIGVDIGGTFTDIFLVEDGNISHRKVLTTSDDPSKAVKEFVLKNTPRLSNCKAFVHGTTVATNAIIEQKYPLFGLITTRGHKDRIEIQRTNALQMYDFFYHKPKPLVPREFRMEVKERIKADGKVLDELSTEDVIKATSLLKEKGIDLIVICFLNSYLNPKHELEAKKIIKENFTDMQVVTSFETLPEILEYERFSTTVLNASLVPAVSSYVSSLEDFLIQRSLQGPFLIMLGNGGVAAAQTVKSKPGATFQSGPAGGVMGALYIGNLIGYKNLICFDMGGTSTDVSVIKEGEPATTTDYYIERRPFRFPFVDIISIGAGGGSLAWVDDGGGLHVGPQSAGADPGPACYELGGTEPTVTDAHVVLGRLPDGFVLGGDVLPVKKKSADKAVAKIANFYNMTITEAAAGILEIINSNMAGAIRAVTIEKGLEPKDFVLMAYGGAGPLHAGAVARELGIKRILLPPYPGTHCALGLLVSDYKHDFVRSIVKPLNSVNIENLENIFLELERNGKELLLEEGVDEDNIQIFRYCDLRYIGQAYIPVSIPIASNTGLNLDLIRDDFYSTHETLYKHADYTEPVELVNARVTAIGLRPKDILSTTERIHQSIEIDYKPVYFNELSSFVDTPFYQRNHLNTGDTIEGPAIVLQSDTTAIIYPNQTGIIDMYGNIIIDL